MIKKIAYIWLLAVIGIMAACTEDTFVDNRTKVDDDHLLVTFRTQVPEMTQVTTRNADHPACRSKNPARPPSQVARTKAL